MKKSELDGDFSSPEKTGYVYITSDGLLVIEGKTIYYTIV